VRHGAAWARERFEQSPVARLATVSADGVPHVVPVVFVVAANRVISAVDHKPKSTTALRRLDNIAANPAVSLLVDHYDEDWSQLWWARADGRARVHEAYDLRALVARYPQYREQPPSGPVIVVEVERWSGWSG
jgi:PPOX class probable F420-dependent enzyme